MRRARRHSSESLRAISPLIDALVARYRDAGLPDDSSHAAMQAQSLHRRGSLQAIRARLAAKGVASSDVADAVRGLCAAAPDPVLRLPALLPPAPARPLEARCRRPRANSTPSPARVSPVVSPKPCSPPPISRR